MAKGGLGQKKVKLCICLDVVYVVQNRRTCIPFISGELTYIQSIRKGAYFTPGGALLCHALKPPLRHAFFLLVSLAYRFNQERIARVLPSEGV